MRATPLALACLSILGCTLLPACNPAGDSQPAPAQSAEVPAAVAPATDGAAPAAAAASAAPADASAPAAPAPQAAAVIASADGEKPGIRVEVTELKRGSGDTVSLKFVLINDSDEQFGIMSNYLGDTSLNEDFASVGAVHLVDAVGKKKYMVVRDSQKQCVCSSSVKDLPAHTRANLWAKFPAPPAGTNMVSIVVPHFSPMDDVAIAQ